MSEEIYDADAARVARGYTPGAQWYFEINCNVYSLPVEIGAPLARKVAELSSSEQADLALDILLGSQAPAFSREYVTLADANGILAAYIQATYLGGMIPKEALVDTFDYAQD